MCMKEMRRLSGIKHKMWACDWKFLARGWNTLWLHNLKKALWVWILGFKKQPSFLGDFDSTFAIKSVICNDKLKKKTYMFFSVKLSVCKLGWILKLRCNWIMEWLIW